MTLVALIGKSRLPVWSEINLKYLLRSSRSVNPIALTSSVQRNLGDFGAKPRLLIRNKSENSSTPFISERKTYHPS